LKLRPWLAALVALPFSTSCSLMFVDGPKPVDQRGGYAPACTSSAAWPIVDLLWTGNYVLGAAYWGSMSDEDLKKQSMSRGAAVGTSIALGTLALTSAIVGFTRVGECQEEQAHGARGAYRTSRGPSRAVQQQEEAAEEADAQARIRAQAVAAAAAGAAAAASQRTPPPAAPASAAAPAAPDAPTVTPSP
jgi:hypothetical protein